MDGLILRVESEAEGLSEHEMGCETKEKQRHEWQCTIFANKRIGGDEGQVQGDNKEARG